jgi:hypothetical protein
MESNNYIIKARFLVINKFKEVEIYKSNNNYISKLFGILDDIEFDETNMSIVIAFKSIGKGNFI